MVLKNYKICYWLKFETAVFEECKNIIGRIDSKQKGMDGSYDVQRLKHSNDKNEVNNADLVPTSSEMSNVLKSMCSYLDAHSNGEMNNKMDIEQSVDN
ncbi:hypothetical protein TNCV_2880641 [Trichonephila clavipes]|nr:hypothetical protein TNCV_2880641 [Trichonephila clavipes]